MKQKFAAQIILLVRLITSVVGMYVLMSICNYVHVYVRMYVCVHMSVIYFSHGCQKTDK